MAKSPRYEIHELDPALVEILRQESEVREFLNEIGMTFFSVQFVKMNGDISEVINARLNVTSRMANNELSDAARETLAKNNQIPYVDRGRIKADNPRSGWGSFKPNRVTYLKGLGREIGMALTPTPKAE